jgi:predicted RNase H-like HicB family nuclease
MELPWSYTIEKRNDDGVYYYARVNELNCFSEGQTMAEATLNIQKALEVHLEAAIEAGADIPKPLNLEDFKGQVSYRTKPEKHYRLAKEAQRKGISINKLIDSAVDDILSA